MDNIESLVTVDESVDLFDFSSTTEVTQMCSKCQEFWSKPGYNACSNCLLEMSSNDKILTMSLDEIFALPDSAFKSKAVETRLFELYEMYRINNRVANRLITKSEFKQLKIMCRDKNTGEIGKILDGQTDFPATALTAAQADKLLAQVFTYVKSDIWWTYVHAICPFVVDRWNLKTNENVLRCYYKNTDNLVSCPTTKVQLYLLWQYIRDSGFPSVSRCSISSEPIYDCTYCSTSVYVDQTVLKCRFCNLYHHMQCMIDQYNNSPDKSKGLKCNRCEAILKLEPLNKDKTMGDMYCCRGKN